LTSIARGNVPAAVCSAAGSNLAGLFLTPILFGLVSGVHGNSTSLAGINQIVLQLLIPFAAGQVARPQIGKWAERNKSILSITDRGSILLIVYPVFSASVVQGLWRGLPTTTLVVLALIVAMLLATALLIMISGSRFLRFDHADEIALVFCGSQKSVVSGIPIASALIAGPALGFRPADYAVPLDAALGVRLVGEEVCEPFRRSARLPRPLADPRPSRLTSLARSLKASKCWRR
jgi:sodium/bile acid cotransporter 7